MMMVYPKLFHAVSLVTMFLSLISTSAASMQVSFVTSDNLLLTLIMLLLLIEMVDGNDTSDGIKLPVFSSGVKFMVWWT